MVIVGSLWPLTQWSSQCYQCHVDLVTIYCDQISFIKISPFIQEIHRLTDRQTHSRTDARTNRCMYGQLNCLMPPAPNTRRRHNYSNSKPAYFSCIRNIKQPITRELYCIATYRKYGKWLYMLHNLEVSGSGQPFTSVYRRIDPDASTSGSPSWHLQSQVHLMSYLHVCTIAGIRVARECNEFRCTPWVEKKYFGGVIYRGNCKCNWGTCIAPPTRRPMAHHRVNPYLGGRRQNETKLF